MKGWGREQTYRRRVVLQVWYVCSYPEVGSQIQLVPFHSLTSLGVQTPKYFFRTCPLETKNSLLVQNQDLMPDLQLLFKDVKLYKDGQHYVHALYQNLCLWEEKWLNSRSKSVVFKLICPARLNSGTWLLCRVRSALGAHRPAACQDCAEIKHLDVVHTARGSHGSRYLTAEERCHHFPTTEFLDLWGTPWAR